MPITLLDPWVLIQSNITSAVTTLPLGTNWQPGDLRIAFLSTSASRSYTIPPGWATLYNNNASSGANAAISRRLTILARTLQAGDTSPNMQINGDPGPNVANTGLTLRGADNAALLGSVPTVAGSSSTSSRDVVAPSVPTGAGILLTDHLVTRMSNASSGSWSGPSGMAVQASAIGDGGPIGYNVLLASEPRSSGASGTRTAVAGSAGNWTAASLFVPETAVVAGPEPGRALLAV